MNEVTMLRAQIETLERLLEQTETVVAQQAERLESALSEANDRASRLALSEREVLTRNERLAENEREKAALIERLRLAIDEISVPVLEVADDVLALPLVGVIDERRGAQLTEKLLGEIGRRRTRTVVLDISGVVSIDTHTAGVLVSLVRAARLLGARCVLSGVQPSVASTLSALGVELHDVPTVSTVKDVLRRARR